MVIERHHHYRHPSSSSYLDAFLPVAMTEDPDHLEGEDRRNLVEVLGQIQAVA